MPKLTAEFFSQLPEDLQQKILKEVPLDRLNDIEVMTPADLDIDKTNAELRETLVGLKRSQALTVIVELINAMSQQMLGPDAPASIRMAASLSILKQVVSEADKHLLELGGFEDDED